MTAYKIGIIFCVVAIVGSLAGCASRQYTAAEKAYGQAVMNQPTTFYLPKEKSDEAWARAQVFVAQYSNMKIQIATSNVLQTYNPTGSWPRYGYYLTRMQTGDSVQFVVKGICSNMFSQSQADGNAHVLAYYMVTGELMPDAVAR